MELVIPGVFVGAIIIGGGALYRYWSQQQAQKAEAARTAPMIERAMAQAQADQAPSQPTPGPTDGGTSQ